MNRSSRSESNFSLTDMTGKARKRQFLSADFYENVRRLSVESYR